MRQRIDPEAKQALLAVAAARIGVGVGALVATGPALRGLGFGEAGPRARTLARAAGSRDIAIGLLAFAARNDRSRLRTAGLAAAGVDATDAVTFGLLARDPELRFAGAGSSLAGVAAVIVGGWACARLR